MVNGQNRIIGIFTLIIIWVLSTVPFAHLHIDVLGSSFEKPHHEIIHRDVCQQKCQHLNPISSIENCHCVWLASIIWSINLLNIKLTQEVFTKFLIFIDENFHSLYVLSSLRSRAPPLT